MSDITPYLLRPWREEDISSLVHHANNINVSRFLTDAFPFPYTEVHARQFIVDSLRADPLQRMAIEVVGEAVGSIGIHPQSDIMRLNAELGYWLSEGYWGKGIMTRVIREMVEYGFKNFDVTRIYARPFGNNEASARVLVKAGFALEAKIGRNIIKNGELLDELIYAIRK